MFLPLSIQMFHKSFSLIIVGSGGYFFIQHGSVRQDLLFIIYHYVLCQLKPM